MKRLCLLLALPALGCMEDHNVGTTPRSLGDARWSIVLGGAQHDRADTIAIDRDGDVLAAGRFQGTIDLGAGPVTTLGTESSWISKRAGQNGGHLWSVTLGTANLGSVEVASLVVDDQRNTIVTGRYRGTPDFGGATLTSASDAFIAKYTADGDLAWVRGLGAGSQADGVKVAVGRDRRIYVSGTYQGAIYTADRLLVADGVDGYLAAYEPDGTQRWVRAMPSAFDLAVTSDGAIVASTSITRRVALDTVTLDPDASATQVLVQLAPDGSVAWARTVGATGVALHARALAIGADDQLVVAGFSEEANVFPARTHVSQADADGALLWSASSTMGRALVRDATILSDGTIATAGQLIDRTVDLGDGLLHGATFLALHDATGAVVETRALGDQLADPDAAIAALASSPTHIAYAGQVTAANGQLDAQLVLLGTDD